MQRENCVEPAKRDAVPGIGDILNVVGSQDVGGKRPQASKDARVAADPARIFSEASIADVVQAILNAPVPANSLGANRGRQGNVGDE